MRVSELKKEMCNVLFDLSLKAKMGAVTSQTPGYRVVVELAFPSLRSLLIIRSS
jgi:hypothetical protein